MKACTALGVYECACTCAQIAVKSDECALHLGALVARLRAMHNCTLTSQSARAHGAQRSLVSYVASGYVFYVASAYLGGGERTFFRRLENLNRKAFTFYSGIPYYSYIGTSSSDERG